MKTNSWVRRVSSRFCIVAIYEENLEKAIDFIENTNLSRKTKDALIKKQKEVRK